MIFSNCFSSGVFLGIPTPKLDQIGPIQWYSWHLKVTDTISAKQTGSPDFLDGFWGGDKK